MSFISLPTGKLHKKTKTKKLNNFPIGYVRKFYINLAQDTGSSVNQDFYGKIANDAEIPSEDVQKYLLATSDFAKGMQTRDALNNVSFRRKLDPIAKNIFCRQNPLELVFKDISTLEAQNPIVGLLLRELDIGNKDVASTLIKKHQILLILIYKAD